MQHIFFIHSNITALVSKYVIEYLELKKENIIISTTNSFKHLFNDFPNVYNVRYELTQNENKSYSNFSKKRYDEIDVYLNKITKGEKFHIYIPHIVPKDFHIIASHKNCAKVNFIEEGLASYILQHKFKEQLFFEKKKKHYVFNFIKNIMFRHGLLRTFTPKHFFDTGYIPCQNIMCYGIYDKSFNFKKKMIITILPFANNIADKKDSNIHYVLLDALIENNLLEISTLEIALSKIVKTINSNDIHVKFHPLQSLEVKELFTKIINFHNKNITIIPNEVVLEEELKNTNDKLIIHGFISSLLFYAKLFGHEIHCHYDLLIDDQTFNKHFQSLNFKHLL